MNMCKARSPASPPQSSLKKKKPNPLFKKKKWQIVGRCCQPFFFSRTTPYAEMPVPDVNAKRTVNTYDPEGQRLVSVWAANYTVLMTDLVPTKNEDGVDTYPIEAVECMFDTLFPDEFRGIIPVFDHRPVDRLLDQRDEILNNLNKAGGDHFPFSSFKSPKLPLGCVRGEEGCVGSNRGSFFGLNRGSFFQSNLCSFSS